MAQACLAIALLIAVGACFAHAETLSVDASRIIASSTQPVFRMGASHSPDGHEIMVTSTCLVRDGKPWLPVMGEFHFSRYPQHEWRDELLKLKAGGINVVASYVFWIHHEEVEGKWDWSERRDLRAFVQTCKDVELPIVVRIGPWDHGEVRQGGFPDWLIDKQLKLRSDDPEYMKHVAELYRQIGEQLKALLWKDGGPVIGVQVENEFGGRGEHLLNLKRLARDVGLDVPLYTRTGWPTPRSPVPFGEILPLYGAYSEGFWDRSLKSMPGKYWEAFVFAPQRTDTAVATDQLGQREAKDDHDVQQYPYLTCELGGGMMSSYHRRILVDPRDAIAIATVKVGSGSNLPGYYMYHGGTNPDSTTGITLQESQATRTTNYNDMPVKNYDFQAPLGEFGQVRESYRRLRRLHMFLTDWGEQLAPMGAVFPETRPTDQSDTRTLRWSVRSDGDRGFLFVNNYQRGVSMPEKKGVQFEVKLRNQTVRIPTEPVTIPADSTFIWPINLNLGGLKIVYATAQPLAQFNDHGTRWVFFAQTPGVESDFVLDDKVNGLSQFRNLKPSREPVIAFKNVRVVLLDDQDSRKLWKGEQNGRANVVISDASVVFDGDTLILRSAAPAMSAQILSDGWKSRNCAAPKRNVVRAELEQIQRAGAPRPVKLGAQKVAEAPTDADFEDAAVWRIKLPTDIDATRRLLLLIHYVGDVARMYLDGKLIADDFYNGNPIDLGLFRFAPDVYHKDLVLKILPIREDAPVFMAPSAKPDFGESKSVCEVKSVEVTEEYEAQIPLTKKGE